VKRALKVLGVVGAALLILNEVRGAIFVIALISAWGAR
jgi:hypothetical protein